MRHTLSFCLLFFFASNLLSAQTPEAVYEEQLAQYFKEKDSNWSLIQSAFDNELKKQGYPISKKTRAKDYHNFFLNFKAIGIERTSETDKIVASIDKLGSIYCEQLEAYQLDNWWSFQYRIVKKESKVKLRVGKHQSYLNNLTGAFQRAQLTPARTASIFAEFFDEEALGHEAYQRIVVCVMYWQMLPSEMKDKAVEALAKTEKVLDEFFAKHALNWETMQAKFDKYAAVNYGVLVEQQDTPDYLNMFEEIEKSDKLDAFKHKADWFGSVPSKTEMYTELNEALKPIHEEYLDYFHIYHPILGYCSIVEALAEYPDASPPLLMGGYKLTYNEVDVVTPVHQKCFMTIMYPMLITGWVSEFDGADHSSDGNVTFELEGDDGDHEPIAQIVDDMPEFPGGQNEMMRFISTNIKYPETAKLAEIQGKVYIQFVVGKDGSIGDVQVLRGIGGGCDEAAVKVVEAMPKWSPGKQNGVAVRVLFTLPISFMLK